MINNIVEQIIKLITTIQNCPIGNNWNEGFLRELAVATT